MDSRRKRQKPKDTSFHPHQKRARHSTNDENFIANMFTMRAQGETTQVDAQGNIEPIKNTFLVKQSVVPPHCSIKAINAAATVIASKAPTYRPVGEVIYQNGSPVKVLTPKGKTPLPRVAAHNAVSFFSNSRLLEELRDITPINKMVADVAAFKETKSYQNLLKVLTAFKEQSVHITRQLLSSSLKERKDHHFQRSSQAAALTEPGASTKFSSAKEHVKAAQLVYSEPVKWEWLHLVAYMIWAERSQTSLNLVAGTFACNTEMLMPESLIGYLAKKYPQGFDLLIHADLIEPSNVAWNITYTLKAGCLIIPLAFNPLSNNKPQRDFLNFFTATMKALVEEETKTSPGPDASNAPLEGHFYRPPSL